DHHAAASGPATEEGDEQLAPEDHQHDPQRQPVTEPGKGRSGSGAVREDVERNEGGGQQELVRDRIEELAEVGDQPAGARQVTVPEVRDRGDQEDHEREQPGSQRLDEEQRDDDDREEDPRDRDQVRQVQAALLTTG